MIEVAPKIDDFNLDAYGHLSWVVGYNDEEDEEPDGPLVILAKADTLTDEDLEDIENEVGVRDCGDWIACADFDRQGDFVGYHVVANSDAGSFVETVEKGVYTLEDARKHLPGLLETWNDVASESLVSSRTWYTKQEIEENNKAIQRWKAELKEALA